MSKSIANMETIIRLGPAMCKTQANEDKDTCTTRVPTVGSLDSLATSAGETASKECTMTLASIEFENSSSPKEEENFDMAFDDVASPHACAPLRPMLPSGSRHVRPVFKARKNWAQEFFDNRLAGLKPSHFHPHGIAMYTTSEMTPPLELQQVSKVVTWQYASRVLPSDEVELLSRVPAVVIFCNIYDAEEMKLAKVLSICITDLGDDAPPTILVPHVPSSSKRDKKDAFVMLADAVSSGIDCTISGCYEGLKLALMVRAEIASYAGKVNLFNKALNAHRERVQYAQDLDDSREDALWEYGRVRLGTGIPRADADLDEVRPGLVLGDLQVSRQVGEGSSGKVYALEKTGVAPVIDAPSSDSFPFDTEPTCDSQVLKAILKKNKLDMHGLLELRNEIRVMKSLSSADGRHPNIVRLHEVYHSETHIMFRMDDGGPRDLYKCLRAHEVRQVPLGPDKVNSLILQCAGALSHLHLVVNVVHRDIKPENIIIRETRTDINAKIADFDLASSVQRRPARSTFCGGTFPFTAPEMRTGKPYDPFAADVWSMAVVFLEVFCGCNVLAKALAFPRLAPHDPQKRTKQQAMSKDIQNFFEAPGSVNLLLRRFNGPALEEFVNGGIQELLSNEDGMLVVDPSQRLTAEEITSGFYSP